MKEMKTLQFSNKDEWMAGRLGRITGSRLKDIVSSVGIQKEAIISELEKLAIPFKKTARKEDLEMLLPKESLDRLSCEVPKKKGYYELIAERIALPPDGENPMDRGNRLEDVAIERFSQETGKKVDTTLVIWTRDDNDNIAYSPDGRPVLDNDVIDEEEVCEVKCLNSASHIEAWLTQKIPSEYEFQKLQAFIVNENLQTMYFIFYDPRIPSKEFFYFTIKRKDVQEQVEKYLAQEKAVLEDVERVAKELTF